MSGVHQGRERLLVADRVVGLVIPRGQRDSEERELPRGWHFAHRRMLPDPPRTRAIGEPPYGDRRTASPTARVRSLPLRRSAVDATAADQRAGHDPCGVLSAAGEAQPPAPPGPLPRSALADPLPRLGALVGDPSVLEILRLRFHSAVSTGAPRRWGGRAGTAWPLRMAGMSVLLQVAPLPLQLAEGDG
jgi:hypothetical protein